MLPLTFSDHELLVELTCVLEETFRIPTVILNKPFPLDDGKDYVRNQYNSTWILSQILERFPEEECKILGVTSVDLFVPVLTYVFGEAQLDGKTAVVSTHRLKNELYGLPRNPQKLRERFEKEAIHELGHTFGLIHCPQPRCVMYTYTYAEEIDFKSKHFCPACLQELSEKLKE